jgi:hypothetical protein
MRIHCPLTPLSILPIPACAIWLIASPHVAVAADNAETMRYCASVTDISGHAIAGALVQAYQYPTQGRGVDPELVTNATSGVDGKFEVTLRPYSPLVVIKPGLAPAWRDPSPNATNSPAMVLSPPTTSLFWRSGQQDIRLVVEPLANIEGKVETESLPWLILVNSQGRVATEGFSLEDLPRQIASLGE